MALFSDLHRLLPGAFAPQRAFRPGREINIDSCDLPGTDDSLKCGDFRTLILTRLMEGHPQWHRLRTIPVRRSQRYDNPPVFGPGLRHFSGTGAGSLPTVASRELRVCHALKGEPLFENEIGGLSNIRNRHRFGAIKTPAKKADRKQCRDRKERLHRKNRTAGWTATKDLRTLHACTKAGGHVQLENKLIRLNSPAAHYAAPFRNSPAIPVMSGKRSGRSSGI